MSQPYRQLPDPARFTRIGLYGAWAAMTASAVGFVLHFGHNIPWGDEWEFVPVLSGHEPPTAGWLWQQHNEHRYPLPRLVYLALFFLFGDLRAGMLFQVVLISGLALGLMRYLERVRGRAAWTDVCVPVGLLNWGHAENMLMAYQVNFALTAVLMCALLVAVNQTREGNRHRPALLVGVLVILLELCGASGLVVAVPVAVWLLGLTWRGRAVEPVTRAGLAVLVLAAIVYIALYFTAYERPIHHPRTELHHAGLVAVIALQYLAMAFGLAAAPVWPTVSIAILWLTTSAGRRLARSRAWGLLAVLAGLLLLALTIGYGRAGFEVWTMGLWSRYGWLAWPVVFLGYLVFASDDRGFGRWACRAVAAVTLAFLPFNVAVGWSWGSSHDRWMRALVADIDAGLPPAELVKKHLEGTGQEERALRGMPMLRDAGVGPFERLRRESP